MIRVARFAVADVAVVCLALVASSAVAQEKAAAKPAPSQEELEKQFADTMSGATLIGNFTIVGLKSDKPLREDRYTLGKVKKIKDDLWSFEARITYGDHDVKLPLALPVKWAGDTPVISVTDVTFPGLGTYSARVLVYRGWYAGTWHGGDHGGQMFGRIEKAADAPADKPAAK
jgi:hypothetical protein